MTGPEQEVLSRLNDEYRQIEDLVRSPGWAMFKEEMEKARDFSYQKITQSDSPVDVHRHSGAYHVARSVLTWPEREMERIVKEREAYIQQIAQEQARRSNR